MYAGLYDRDWTISLAHANVEINTFPMIYYKGFRNQN